MVVCYHERESVSFKTFESHNTDSLLDAPITTNSTFTRFHQPQFNAPLSTLPLPRLPSQPITTGPNTSNIHHPTSTVPKRRGSRTRSQFIPIRQFSNTRLRREDLLRGVPGGIKAERELCVHGMHLWTLPAVCGCVDGGTGCEEEVSKVQYCGGEI